MDSNKLQCNILHDTEPQHIPNRTDAIPYSIKHLLIGATRCEEQFRTYPEQHQYSSVQSRCVKCVHQSETPEDLMLVVNEWQELAHAGA